MPGFEEKNRIKSWLRSRSIALIGGIFIFCGIVWTLHSQVVQDGYEFDFVNPLGPVSTLETADIDPVVVDSSTVKFTDILLEYGASASLFNAVHSSMRQWGSSINHNGMTLFPATLRKGQILYHGRGNAAVPEGPQWLAFEMEQANSFANAGGRRGSPRNGGPPKDGPPYSNVKPSEAVAGLGKVELAGETESTKEVLMARTPKPIAEKHGGFIHTFRATRPWKLLYMDGMSAGKSALGTLDMQHLLIGWSQDRSGPQDERERAMALCEWQRNEGYDLDGFIRMEVDFEIIFCDFASDSIELLTTVQKPEDTSIMRKMQHWQWLKSAERSYDGIGGSRISLDYSNMVSVYGRNVSHPLDLTLGLPRLNELTEFEIDTIKKDIDEALHRSDATGKTNWRDRADWILSRYSSKIQSLEFYSSPEGENAKLFTATLNSMFVHLWDQRLPEDTRRIQGLKGCIYEYLPTVLESRAEQTLFSAFEEVTSMVCHTLTHLMLSEDLNLHEKGEIVKMLKQSLRWTSWSKCGSCAEGEMCFLPMWPFGGPEDRIPKCVGMEDVSKHHGYWQAHRD